MHDLEPHYNWRHLYISSEDERSPFFGTQNSEVYYTDKIYNFVIHPQWDYFGSETLFLKVIFADYVKGYVVIELLGEWNDLLHNDIMWLKRKVVEPLISEGIDKFILIGENVLNFHADSEDYYEEWLEEVEEGWIAALNFREHVLMEIKQYNIDRYLILGGNLDDISWRSKGPSKLFEKVSEIVHRRLY